MSQKTTLLRVIAENNPPDDYLKVLLTATLHNPSHKNPVSVVLTAENLARFSKLDIEIVKDAIQFWRNDGNAFMDIKPVDKRYNPEGYEHSKNETGKYKLISEFEYHGSIDDLRKEVKEYQDSKKTL